MHAATLQSATQGRDHSSIKEISTEPGQDLKIPSQQTAPASSYLIIHMTGITQ